MTQEPTIEELQKQILEANKKSEEIETAFNALKTESEKIKTDLDNARKINAELWLKQKGGTSPNFDNADGDDSEALTPEKALDALLDDAIKPNLDRMKKIYGESINTDIVKE